MSEQKTYEQDFIDEVIDAFAEGFPKAWVCKHYNISRQTLNSFLQERLGFYSLEHFENMTPEQIAAAQEFNAKREQRIQENNVAAAYYIREMQKVRMAMQTGTDPEVEEMPEDVKEYFERMNRPRPHATRISMERMMEPKKAKAAPKQRIHYSRKKK